jgi:DNA ligase-1
MLLAKEPVMLSSEENHIVSCPHILEEARRLVQAYPFLSGLELDGENYSHGTLLQDIHSIVSRKTGGLHDDYEDIQYHVFDMVVDTDQETRLQAVSKVFQLNFPFQFIKPVKMYWAESLSDINMYLELFMKAGYEGIIIRDPSAHYVRRRSTQMMKFKPRKSDVYQIVGLQEEVSIHGVSKGTLGAFLLRGTDGTTFRVGTGFTAEQRKIFYNHQLVGKWAKILYQTKSKDGVPCHSVFVSVQEQPIIEDDFGVEVPDIWT